MIKKLLATLLTISILLSFAVVPTYAETNYNTGTFSSANWAQYERGFYTSTDKFTQCKEVYANTSYGDDQLISVRMVANNKTVTAGRNPIAYKFGENLSAYGDYESVDAVYAHMRVYLASFSDQWRDCFNKFTMRIDKQGDGSSRDFAIFETYTRNNQLVTETYATNYNYSRSYMSKLMLNGKQGRLGNGPDGNVAAADVDSKTRTLADSDYDKLDLISEFNKQGGATNYLFVNGQLACIDYDSGLDINEHFHGIVFRTVNTSARVNSDYIAVKFDSDRIGHREYYNTSDYKVTFEDVLQDAGLGEGNDSRVMFKTTAVQNYMPGDDQSPYVYRKDASERERFNEKVTYTGNTATITVTNEDTENYEIAAHMLAGVYPLNGKCGVSYESYHPRAKYIKLSFDQTISHTGMWLHYGEAINLSSMTGTSTYDLGTQAIQMWNNDGSLVVAVKGAKSVTCNGNGNKPLATMTGTNHIDWILEPDGENNRVNQYVYINNVFAASGYFGNENSARINDIILSTKNKEGTVTISNWSMTLYNSAMDITDFDNGLLYDRGFLARWRASGVERGTGENSDKFVIYGQGINTHETDIPVSDTKIYTALYDEAGNLLDLGITDYVTGRTIGSETEENLFNISYGGVAPKTAKMLIWNPLNRQAYAQFSELELSFE